MNIAHKISLYLWKEEGLREPDFFAGALREDVAGYDA
jgi:hypothetical protein